MVELGKQHQVGGRWAGARVYLEEIVEGVLPAQTMLPHQPGQAEQGRPFDRRHTVDKHRPMAAQLSQCRQGLLQLANAEGAPAAMVRQHQATAVEALL